MQNQKSLKCSFCRFFSSVCRLFLSASFCLTNSNERTSSIIMYGLSEMRLDVAAESERFLRKKRIIRE